MIKDLLNYQKADAKLRKIEVELSSSPARKKMASAKTYLEGVEENVNKLDDKAARLNSEYQNLIEKQAKLNDQLVELKGVMADAQDEGELAFLSKKADEILANIKTLAASINTLNDEFQKVIKEYASIRNTTKSAQAQFAESKEEYNKQKASVQAEKDQITAELDALKGNVDATLMEKYLKKRANKMFPIVFEVTSNVCGACNMELSMSEQTKLKNGEIIECDQCGRLLYKNGDK